MKALVYEGVKQLRVVDVPKPLPKEGEALVKIKACGICGSDIHGYMGITGRRIAPMIMGHEFAGEIEALGSGTSEGFRPGDRVTVQPVHFCGRCENCRNGYTNLCTDKHFLGILNVDGAFQEYLCVPEKLLYELPNNISFEEGALIEALAVSYCGVKKAGSLTGKQILIVGGGTIGQLALIVAKAQNPQTIIMSDLSDARLSIAKNLGADYVINPKDEDFREKIKKALGGSLVDVSIEAVGAAPTVAQAMSALKPRGTCVWIGNSVRMIELDMQAVVTQELKVFGTYIYTHNDFGETIKFMEENNLDLRQLISARIPISKAPKLFRSLTTETEKYLKVLVTF